MMMVKLNWMDDFFPGSDDELGFEEIEVAQSEDEDEDTKYDTINIYNILNSHEYFGLVTVKEIASKMTTVILMEEYSMMLGVCMIIILQCPVVLSIVIM